MTDIEFTDEALRAATPPQLTAILNMCGEYTSRIKVVPGTFDLPAGYLCFYRYARNPEIIPTYGGIDPEDGAVST